MTWTSIAASWPLLEDPMSYDDRAASYAAHTRDNAYNAYYERPGLLSLVDGVYLRSKHVLDAGCGPGHHAAWLAGRDARVTALDRSAEMLKLAAANLPSDARIVQADLSRPLVGLEDDSFDVILSSLTLHYIEDLSVPFSEFARVARPGARLVFSMHHPYNDLALNPRADYFESAVIEETWNLIDGTTLDVRFFARSLADILSPLTHAGWTRYEILEPLPISKCQRHFPEQHARIRARPPFLFVRASQE